MSVVIPSYDDRRNLTRCLCALDGEAVDVVVVDNGSRDGTADLVRDRFPWVKLVALADNRGFAAAANAGLELAVGRYVALLNSDASPLEGALRRLVDFAESNPDAGVIGPLLVNADGTLQRSVRGFPTLWRLATELFFLRKLGPRTRALNAFYAAGFDHRSTAEAEFVKGAVLFIRREALDEVGAFDERFLVFSEDVDLCYRMRRAGWRVLYYPGASFLHVGGASTRRRWDWAFREQFRSQLLFFAKHQGVRTAARARWILVAGLYLRALLFRGDRSRSCRLAAAWLASTDLPRLLGPDP